jgi:uncharacterized protein (DUF488 family)
MNLYTLGYQGIDLSTYVNTLKEAGVGVVIDVRETPWSHKRGFCKTSLSAELLKAGIDYIHLRSAGNPKENRRTAASMEECLRRYRRYLEKNPKGVTDLVALLEAAKKQRKSACLTCFEKAPHECHRSILASSVISCMTRLTAVHLQAQ